MTQTASKKPKRWTQGVVEPKKPRQLPGLKPDEIEGDRGLGDFHAWVLNFVNKDSGHFVGPIECGEFADKLAAQIERMGGRVDKTNVSTLALWIEAYYQGTFVDHRACLNFIVQVERYIAVDGYIGQKK